MEIATGAPYTLDDDSGVAEVWWLGGKMTMKATGAETKDRFAHIQATDPRGTAAPLHLHEDASESFYIIDGEVTLFIGDDETTLGPGGFAFVPPGVTHSYLVRSQEARFYVTIAPAGTENFFVELGTPVRPGEPRPAFVPPDPEEFARRAAAYGIQIVGPPPKLDSRVD